MCLEHSLAAVAETGGLTKHFIVQMMGQEREVLTNGIDDELDQQQIMDSD